MEGITDGGCRHMKRVSKNLETKYRGEYHDLYVESNKLLLADIFENFQNLCLEIYKLGPIHFLSTTGLAKEPVKPELLTDVDMLLMVGKDTRNGICHTICQCATATNLYIKNYDENKESNFMYDNINNFHEKVKLQKLPAGRFKYVRNRPQFSEVLGIS